jgi:hypothetical protein
MKLNFYVENVFHYTADIICCGVFFSSGELESEILITVAMKFHGGIRQIATC